jgi:hypothetical protein
MIDLQDAHVYPAPSNEYRLEGDDVGELDNLDDEDDEHDDDETAGDEGIDDGYSE